MMLRCADQRSSQSQDITRDVLASCTWNFFRDTLPSGCTGCIQPSEDVLSYNERLKGKWGGPRRILWALTKNEDG